MVLCSKKKLPKLTFTNAVSPTYQAWFITPLTVKIDIVHNNVKASGETGDAEKCWAAMVEVGFLDFEYLCLLMNAFRCRLTGGSLKSWPSWTRRDM